MMTTITEASLCRVKFWKVVTMVKDVGLSATGYLLSQEELIAGLECCA